MTAFSGAAFGTTYGWATLATAGVLAVTFGVAKRAGKHSVIDTAWGLLFAVIAVCAFIGSHDHGDAVRRWLLLALPVLWGTRLAVHIGRRTVGKDEDPRYARLLRKARSHPDLYALGAIYALQGVLALFVGAPIVVGAFEPGPVRGLAWVGVALWCVGVFFEAVGDRQLERFRRDPTSKGRIMDTGLWRYTRHPNYFGDACVWWGIYLVAAERWPGALTVAAPIAMTLLLTTGSGVRIMEGHMSSRPGWVAYTASTSAFLPRPPKR
jgi:steroid 5-alpha reductase family enzyme